MDSKATEILSFQIERAVVSAYKRGIVALEDVRLEHVEMLTKLKKALPSQYLDLLEQVDYFSDNKFQQHRKRILDNGNEAIRNIVEKQLPQFDIEFGQG